MNGPLNVKLIVCLFGI